MEPMFRIPELAARARRSAAALAMACVLAIPGYAQADRMTPIATPAQPAAIVLETGSLPGAKASES
jgi:hypothetical protein